MVGGAQLVEQRGRRTVARDDDGCRQEGWGWRGCGHAEGFAAGGRRRDREWEGEFEDGLPVSRAATAEPRSGTSSGRHAQQGCPRAATDDDEGVRSIREYDGGELKHGGERAGGAVLVGVTREAWCMI